MTRMHEEIDNLLKKLLDMAKIVIGMVENSIKALIENKPELLEKVFVDEKTVNKMEIEIEEEAIGIDARYQPEAQNLRTVIMVIKINKDLERIGDHAVNIANRVKYLVKEEPVKPYIDLPKLANVTTNMLKDSINAFIEKNTGLAHNVCLRDDLVDKLYRNIVTELIEIMGKRPETVERGLKIIEICKNLERIADLATNICEDVIYMVEGRVIMHRFDQEL